MDGTDIQRLCDERTWSRRRLVFELRRAATAAGETLPGDESLERMIRQWANSQRGLSALSAGLLSSVFGVDFEVSRPAVRASSAAPAPVDFRSPWLEFVGLAGEEWESDVERREFLRGAGYAAVASTEPALQWFLGSTETVSRDAGRVAVGSAHVKAIREMTQSLRRLDNLHGGGRPRRLAVDFLTADVKPLILDGRYSGDTGGQLLAAAAELIQLVGWMTFDAGSYGSGQRYSAQALRLAMATGQRALGAEVLAGLSHQASYLGDGKTAIDLAQAANRTASELGVDALVAEAYVMEAHGHACLRDAVSCTKALSNAERALDKADRDSDPLWMTYFDEAYLSAKFAHCFRELRDSKTAVIYAERSLDMDPGYVRGRFFNLALLATSHAQTGNADEACRVGMEAVALAPELKSERSLEYLRRLQGELAGASTTLSVRHFEAQVAPLLVQAA